MINLKIKRIFLIDAYIVIFRNYFAIIKKNKNNIKNIIQYLTSSFIYFINNILHKEQPTHIIVVFDSKGITLKHQEYYNYKSNRKKTPKEIIESIPYIFKCLKLLNIKILYIKGYEADDIIGSIAKKAYIKGYKIYIVTIDKDFSQLVNDNIQIYNYYEKNKLQIMGVKEICKKYEIEQPRQFIDLFSMIGDKSDNIPGIPGIGEKNAKKLIKKYHNLENLFDHVNELNGKLQDNIKKYKNLGLLSKKLITIITNVPIIWKEKDCYFKKKIYDKNLIIVLNLIKQIN